MKKHITKLKVAKAHGKTYNLQKHILTNEATK
jgi:hypothetical protein